jgi:hypothetical protein
VFSFYCIYGGVAGIFRLGVANDQFITVLGQTLSHVFNIAYFLSGISLYFGTGLRKKEIEVFGLCTIITSLLVRVLAISWLSGLDDRIVGLYIVNMAFIVACLVRLYTLFNYEFAVSIIDKTKNEIVAGLVK